MKKTEIKILLLEDDDDLAGMFYEYIRKVIPDCSTTVLRTKKQFNEVDLSYFNVLILDVMLPDGELTESDFKKLPDQAVKIIITGQTSFVLDSAKDMGDKYHLFVLRKEASLGSQYFDKLWLIIRTQLPVLQLLESVA
jgi:hypothetical protein